MTIDDIIASRLYNQQLLNPVHNTPADVVAGLGAVQAQDFGAAKWALGSRLPGVNDDAVQQAFNDGKILRTHIMRPTWHFVSPSDIGWLTELTAPRVKVQCASMNRKLALDEPTFKKANLIIAKAIKGNNYLTRPEIGTILTKAGIPVNELRLTFIALRAELDAVTCSGPRLGKQFTYALFTERAPSLPPLHKTDALAALAHRYFSSHGPATIADFVWWSGLTVADARIAVHHADGLRQCEVAGKTYWGSSFYPIGKEPGPSAFLLPNYDEYIIAYKDRSVISLSAQPDRKSTREMLIFNNVVIVRGHIAGIWKRTVARSGVAIDITLFSKLSQQVKMALSEAAERYGKFIDANVQINWQQTK